MMSDIWYSVKSFTLHTAKRVSRATKGGIRSIRYKMDQISTNKKYRTLIKDLGAKVFELSASGVELPPEAADIIHQINQLNEHSATTKDAYVAEKAAVAEQVAADKAAWAEEKAVHAEERAIRKAELEARKQVAAERAAIAKAEALAQAEKAAATESQAAENPQPEQPILEVQETSTSEAE